MTREQEQRLIEFVRDCQFSLDPYVKDWSRKWMMDWLEETPEGGWDERREH